MNKSGFDLDNGTVQATEKQDNPKETRKPSIRRSIQALVHACECRNPNCLLPSCHRMKRVVQHTKACKKKVNGNCLICKQLIALCFYHAKYCEVTEMKCAVPVCFIMKQKMKQQKFHQRLQQSRLLSRRMVVMNSQITESASSVGSSSSGALSPNSSVQNSSSSCSSSTHHSPQQHSPHGVKPPPQQMLQGEAARQQSNAVSILNKLQHLPSQPHTVSGTGMINGNPFTQQSNIDKKEMLPPQVNQRDGNLLQTTRLSSSSQQLDQVLIKHSSLPSSSSSTYHLPQHSFNAADTGVLELPENVLQILNLVQEVEAAYEQAVVEVNNDLPPCKNMKADSPTLDVQMLVGDNVISNTQEWHKQVDMELRERLVKKFAQGILPTPSSQPMAGESGGGNAGTGGDSRNFSNANYNCRNNSISSSHVMQNLEGFVRKVECDIYELACSKSEYYYLLAEKYCKIHKDLVERRQKKRELQLQLQQQQSQVQQPQQPQTPQPTRLLSQQQPLTGSDETNEYYDIVK